MIIHPRIAALMAELKTVTDEVLTSQYELDELGENVLKHIGPFTIEIRDQDGVVARFYEEGIDFYPGPK